MRYFLKFFWISILCLCSACKQATTAQTVLIVPKNPELNASVGKLFLARNRLQNGVHTLPSGLQFSVLQEGMGGLKAEQNDLVTLFYEGRYIDGRIFDNQHSQKPVTIRVSSMIPGWQEAIKMMLPGSIWVLYIPSNLAFGEMGIPNLVGPNQTLIYTVHLLGVVPKTVQRNVP